jgi:malonate transporter
MEPIVDVVLPVFAIVLLGFLSGRSGILGQAGTDALNRFVFYVALPALFFVSMARVPVAETLNLPFLAAYGGGIAATAGVAVGVARVAFPNRLGGLCLNAVSAVFANTGYMGIPLLITAYGGEAAALPAIIATVFQSAVVLTVAIVVLEVDASRAGHARDLARDVATGVLKSPLLLAAVGGLAVSGFQVRLPAAIVTFCDILGAAAAPCALFAIGLFMNGRSFRADLGEVIWLTALKLLVQPAVTAVLAFRVLDMEPRWAESAVILAALPTGALVFVMAQQYGLYVQRSTAAIVVSTVAAVASLSALFTLLAAS